MLCKIQLNFEIIFGINNYLISYGFFASLRYAQNNKDFKLKGRAKCLLCSLFAKQALSFSNTQFMTVILSEAKFFLTFIGQ
jgi:hypothetical protein